MIQIQVLIYDVLVVILLLFVAREQSDSAVVTAAAWLPPLGAGNNNVQQRATVQVPKNIKLLILPGFGNDSSDYMLEQAPVGSLVASLVERGWNPETQIMVLPIQRYDWLQVFWKGLFDPRFWEGTAPPTRPAFRWYLDRIFTSLNNLTTAATDSVMRDDSDSADIKVVLIGHSAGGWLARAALGFGSVGDSDNNLTVRIDLNKIAGVVTLGAPNLPPPPNVMDMTRGALKLTSSRFPGAYHDEIFYLTVIGDAIRGMKQDRKTPFEPTSASGFAYNSYEAVCGNGFEVGDGVVPVISSHLDGAIQLNLNGIFHSINFPDRWYGSRSVIDSWHSEMLIQLNQRNIQSKLETTGKVENPFKNLLF